MAKRTVLAIGIEPSLVDFSAFPGSRELVTSYIKAQIEASHGKAAAFSCLIASRYTGEARCGGRMGRIHETQVHGAGLRGRERRRFERIINPSLGATQKPPPRSQ